MQVYQIVGIPNDFCFQKSCQPLCLCTIPIPGERTIQVLSVKGHHIGAAADKAGVVTAMQEQNRSLHHLWHQFLCQTNDRFYADIFPAVNTRGNGNGFSGDTAADNRGRDGHICSRNRECNMLFHISFVIHRCFLFFILILDKKI